MTDFTNQLKRILITGLLVVTLALALASCSGGKKSGESYQEGSVDDLYNSAMDMLLAQKYTKAAKSFDEVDRQHPYSVWATKAQLMAAYALYMDHQYDEAIIALDRFIQLHPSNRDVAYAHYLKGLAYFEQIKDVKRDQTSATLARKTFISLIKRYPHTKYARDGKHKLDLVHDHLAGREMAIGRYYQKRGQNLAAVNRFKTVVSRYQTTSHVPEALHRLAELYTRLGLKEEARQVAAVLGYNYPASEWYLDSFQLVEGKPPPRPKGALAAKDGKPGQRVASAPPQGRTSASPGGKQVLVQKPGTKVMVRSRRKPSFLARAWDWVF